MSITKSIEDTDESSNEYFMNQVREADQFHDRGIDLCYVYNDHNKALEVLYTAAYLRESLLGKFHADTALSYFRIASILSEYKRNYHDGLKMARRELRLSHRLLAETKLNSQKDKSHLITSKEMRQKQWLTERMSCFKAVLMNVHDISGEEKSKYCNRLLRSIAWEQKGDACATSNDWETALTYYNNAMALECSAYARNLLDTADLQIKMAECLTAMNDLEAAIDELKQAARKYRHVLSVDLGRHQTASKGEDRRSLFPHSTIGDIHTKIAGILLSQHKFDDALGEFAKAFSTYEECLGKTHSKSMKALAAMKVVTVREMEFVRQEKKRKTPQSKEKKQSDGEWLA
ncbi:expressed tetratricopeptide repeat protein [Nitzschia inconspicua]|uniref:Expressed tetratricopeptide repeat protein n=1 Tax=Nitzschia inconspicua TaxID=303405 RepID=A0A9K3QA02_9STRA|nr:expressed tetratricopeptide repeat protein [Nitzschia inconspicua]